MADKQGVSISFDSSIGQAKLGRVKRQAITAITKAINETAGMVQALARSAHPGRPARWLGKARIDPLRMRTGSKAGSFAGGLRFLTDTGVLVKSIQMRKARTLMGVITAEVYSGVAYSDAVEFGTVKARAFPFMRPALISASGWGKRRINKGLIGVLRNA